MELPGIPEGTQNEPKSAIMFPKTSPKMVCRDTLEKIVPKSRAETAPCASRTVNTMVLALPAKCLQAPFRLTFWVSFGGQRRSCTATSANLT